MSLLSFLLRLGLAARFALGFFICMAFGSGPRKDRKIRDGGMGKTCQSKGISNQSMENSLSRGVWLVFGTDSGILFLRKSRHKVISGENGALSSACIISQSGRNLPPDLFAYVADTWESSVLH